MYSGTANDYNRAQLVQRTKERFTEPTVSVQYDICLQGILTEGCRAESHKDRVQLKWLHIQYSSFASRLLSVKESVP